MIRPAKLFDASKIGAILSEFVEETDWLPKLHSKAQDIQHCATMIGNGWVTVFDENGVQGFIARRENEILSLYVAQEWRSSGVGSALIRVAQKEAQSLDLWTFQQNHPARKFYHAMGFKEAQLTYGANNDEGLPDLQLHWERSET